MIGIFDSGVGGLGVVRAIRDVLPDADLVYLADHAYAPYGPRTLESVRDRSSQVAGWLIEQGAAAVTIACNTASAASLDHLRHSHPRTRFIGMEPALKPAVTSSRRGRVGVVATAATFDGRLFARVKERFAGGTDVVTATCPEWVRLVESGITSGASARSAVADCLAPMLESGVDVIVLACTHYPALTSVIAEVAGPDVMIIDPAGAVARQVRRVADALSVAGGDSSIRLVSTGDPVALESSARRMGFDEIPSLLRLP